MTSLFMTALPSLAATAIGLAVGLVLGLVHFAALKRVTELYLFGMSAGRVAGLQLARFTLLAVVLAGLATIGALPLLGGALGVLVGRAIVLRRFGEVS